MKKKLLVCLTLAVLLLCSCSQKAQTEYYVNLLENPGFEQETGTKISGWTIDRYDTSDPLENYRAEANANAPEGKNVLVISSDAENDVRATQTVNVIPDSYYHFSAYVKTENVDSQVYSGANLSVLKCYYTSEYVNGDTDWTRLDLYGKTDNDTHELTLCLRLGFYSADCIGTAYFDDASFERIKAEDIPENADITQMSTKMYEEANSSKKTTHKSIYMSVIIRAVLYAAALSIFAYFALKYGKNLFAKKSTLLIMLLAALLVRIAASVMYVGFKIDINCFAAWGARMAQAGPLKFYSSDYFCDYPPLYMLVLGVVSAIASVLNVSLTQGAGLILLKAPAVICDILCALLIYKITAEKMPKHVAALLAVLYAFNPAAILNSAVWGQVDSILVLFMLLSFWLIQNDKFGKAVITFFIGLLFKPQAGLFGPVMLLAALREFATIFDKNTSKKEKTRRLLWGFGSLFACVAAFFAISFIMKNGQSISWLFEKYMDTIGSYNYATLNSFGFMGLIGGQWAPAENASILGVSYSLLGTVLVILVAAYVVYLFVLGSIKNSGKFDRNKMWLLASVMLAGMVTFSTRTHERYIFPVIALMLVCFALFNDKRMLYISGAYSVLMFINAASVMYIYEDMGQYLAAKDPLLIFGSLATVLLYIYLAYVCYTVISGSAKQPDAVFGSAEAQQKENSQRANSSAFDAVGQKKLNALFAKKDFKLPKVRVRDIIICAAITVIYAFVAFSNLGNTSSPQTYWAPQKAQSYVLVELEEGQKIDSIKYNGLGTGTFDISYSETGNEYLSLGTQYASSTGAYVWATALNSEISAKFLRISASSSIELNEMSISYQGKPVEIKNITNNVSPMDSVCGDGKNLFDCPESVKKIEDQKKPETFYTGGGYIAEFDSLSQVYGAAYYACLKNEAGSLNFSIIDSETGEWADWVYADVSTYEPAWSVSSNYEYIQSDADNKVYINAVNVNVGEIVFLDENDNVVTPKKLYSVSENGEQGQQLTGNFEEAKCFDEQQLYTEYIESVKVFDNTKAWEINAVSDYVIADFGETKNIDRGYFYNSVCTGSFTVFYSYDGISWSEGEYHTVKEGDLYYWHGLPGDASNYASLSARYVAVTATKSMRMLEMGFFESAESTEPIKIANVTCADTGEHSGDKLFDEQADVPMRANYMNSMYFDEIYHARTAYESNNGLSIYEWTHPPLGKDIMSWSISLMGMTPFAWRFPGTLAGVLMIPAIYFLGLLMFRKTAWATMLALLMSLDGMHFVQTRIATIDSFGVLFIILMFLFMFWYYSISFYDVPLKKTFIPLGLCGLSFGLGAASKWICLYAGVGLAVIFFITMARRIKECALARKNLENSALSQQQKAYLKKISDTCVLNICYTVLFCILVFIIIPLVIYCLSYYPYWNVQGESRPWYKIVWNNQVAMYTYHSTLDATHGFQSDWYTWPVIYRPMWFYAGKELPQGQMECISTFGNPIVWYMGLVCTLLALVSFVCKITSNKNLAEKHETGILRIFDCGDADLSDKTERDKNLLLFTFIGIACNLLPWVGISRCIFIYHYFASVPFIMIFTVYIYREIARKNKKVAAILSVLLIIVALILFIMFKPIWTGTQVSKDYVNTYLRWFESWIFGS